MDTSEFVVVPTPFIPNLSMKISSVSFDHSPGFGLECGGLRSGE